MNLFMSSRHEKSVYDDYCKVVSPSVKAYKTSTAMVDTGLTRKKHRTMKHHYLLRLPCINGSKLRRLGSGFFGDKLIDSTILEEILVPVTYGMCYFVILCSSSSCTDLMFVRCLHVLCCDK